MVTSLPSIYVLTWSDRDETLTDGKTGREREKKKSQQIVFPLFGCGSRRKEQKPIFIVGLHIRPVLWQRAISEATVVLRPNMTIGPRMSLRIVAAPLV
nr:hypothetical protein BgiMline_023673 [Biomphalaria glabrata]